MKFQCYTLGCKVNQYETQAMEQQLLALGHVSGTDADDCDAYLINTCTVTAVADRKNRTLIRRLRREHPQAVIGVCGCYAQVSAGEVEALGVDVVSGSGGREAFVQLVLDAVRQKKAGQDAGQQILLDDAMRRRSFESLPAGSLGTRTRAMLKAHSRSHRRSARCTSANRPPGGSSHAAAAHSSASVRHCSVRATALFRPVLPLPTGK